MQQSLINDARTAGEAIANHFVNEFEAGNKAPTLEELSTLEANATEFFAAQSSPWPGTELEEIWREGMHYRLAARVKEFQRPIGNPERGWSAPFGIV